MYILGINAYHGDSSACLLKDGVVICATEEERFRRIKHWAGFPSQAILFCLEDAGITLSEIDHITISRDPRANFYKKVLYSLKYTLSISTIWDRLMNSKKVSSVKGELANAIGVKETDIKAQIHNIEHHRSHIASSFFASRFEKSAILSIDGFGDFTSTMSAIGNGNSFEVLNAVNYPHSLGVFYTTVTQFLGFPNYGDEFFINIPKFGAPGYFP